MTGRFGAVFDSSLQIAHANTPLLVPFATVHTGQWQDPVADTNHTANESSRQRAIDVTHGQAILFQDADQLGLPSRFFVLLFY